MVKESSQSIMISHMSKGDTIHYTIGSQANSDAAIRLVGYNYNDREKSNVIFEYIKKDQPCAGQCKVLTQSSLVLQETFDVVYLEVTVSGRDDYNLKYQSKETALYDTKNNVIAYSDNYSFEDWTDNDFEDYRIDLNVWKKKFK